LAVYRQSAAAGYAYPEPAAHGIRNLEPARTGNRDIAVAAQFIGGHAAGTRRCQLLRSRKRQVYACPGIAAAYGQPAFIEREAYLLGARTGLEGSPEYFALAPPDRGRPAPGHFMATSPVQVG